MNKIIILFLVFCSCGSNKKAYDILYQGYEFDKVHYELVIDKLDQYEKEIVYDSIRFIFKKEFNDSVEIFINGKLNTVQTLFSDNSSSAVPSTEVKILNQYGKNKILLRLINKKRMIEFNYDQRIPFYEISRYNDLWYINTDQGNISKVEQKTN